MTNYDSSYDNDRNESLPGTTIIFPNYEWGFTMPVVEAKLAVAGSYAMDNVHLVSLNKKPSAWHRFWAWSLLGWKWEDSK